MGNNDNSFLQEVLGLQTFPTLYKLSTTGKLLKWVIQVTGKYEGVPAIHTFHGQVGGKIQESIDYIKKGKNIGKVNETTPWEQALSEAASKWKKQFDKGYIDDQDAAIRGESKVAVKPMLAQSFEKHSGKIKYPAFAQPKLDGMRCIAVVMKDQIKLYTRENKLITSMVHIADQLRSLIVDGEQFVGILDGELYNHDLKDDFENIISAARKEDPSDGCEIIQYHIYDIVDCELTQKERLNLLDELKKSISLTENIKLVPTKTVLTESEVEPLFRTWLEDGYEGLMIRNKDTVYEQKRSYSLQKFKVFDECEFLIKGIEEGRGKLAGHAAAFICATDGGVSFKAKLKGSLDYLKECFDDHSLWEGKLLTVQYQGITNKERVPRFPVGKAIRDYE